MKTIWLGFKYILVMLIVVCIGCIDLIIFPQDFPIAAMIIFGFTAILFICCCGVISIEIVREMIKKYGNN